MGHFSYSFCLSLFHSLWQSALLLVCYAGMQVMVKKQFPAFKRNILFGLLLMQAIFSGITFYIYYSGSFHFYIDTVEAGFSSLFLKQPLVEKYSPLITGLYTSVIFIKMIHLIYNWFRFKQMCNSTWVKPSVDIKLFTLTKANEFGIQRKVTIWLSNAVSTPLTFGFLKPVILLPVALLNHLNIADTESLIIHELTHIKNNDYLLNWLLVIAETVFFFNPFVNIISNKIRLEREKNCDVQVLHFKYPAINYAETLLKTAKFKTNINFFPLAAVFNNKQLFQRIHFFTSGDNLLFSKKKYRSIAAPVIITTLFFNLFILREIKNNHTDNDNSRVVTLPKVVQTKQDIMPAAITTSVSKVLSVAQPVLRKILSEQVKVIGRQLKKINEAGRIADEQVAEIVAKIRDENYAIQAAAIETEEKEVIFREEMSGSGEVVTKAYKFKLKNGEWKDELLYVLKEGKPLNDSICYLKDSILKFVPAMQ